jgi:hypothetical protein
MKTKKKIVKKQTDRSMILDYLHQLEDNEMNISYISKRAGVHRFLPPEQNDTTHRKKMIPLSLMLIFK